MKCPNCHKEIADTAKVCGYCGTKLQRHDQPAPPTPQPAPRVESPRPMPVAAQTPATPAVEATAPTTLVSTPRDKLIVPIVLAAIGWGIAEWIGYFYWEPLLEIGGVPFGILINSALYGLFTGLILWWARPSIRWKGAITIFIAWAVSGYYYGLLLEAYGLEVGATNWLLARAFCAILAGAATGWAFLARRQPFPTTLLIIIGICWGFARATGGLILPSMLEVNDLWGWILAEAISGALGVWLTLTVTKLR